MSTKKWVIGNFITGQVTEADILPTIGGSGKVTLNINSEDYATVSVSKRDLPNPADWKTYLKPGYKLVALIDTSKAWNAEGAVLFAGFIKEVRATARETIALQVAGFREYASNRVVLSAQTGTLADPKASKTFTGSTWTNVLNNIANGVWDATGLPSNAPKPPTATKGTVGSAIGTGKSAVIENVNTMRFSDALDYVRDDLSDKGEEYRFVPRWQNSSKARIVWDFVVGTAAAPQINFNRSFAVNLDSENYSIGLGNSLSLTDYATRIVGMSTQTEDATDLTLYNSGSNSDLLIDDVFNPGVELTPAQLNTFTTERLNSQKLLQEEGELLVVSNADETWMTRVGASVSITGGAGIPEVSGMTFNMRLVEVSFSDSNSRVETRVMMNRARFGKLPNSPTSRNRFDNPSINAGVGSGGPITPKLPDNTPPIGGGGGDIQMPSFEDPVFSTKKSVLTFSSTRSRPKMGFASYGRTSDETVFIECDANIARTAYPANASATHAWGSCDDFFETSMSSTFWDAEHVVWTHNASTDTYTSRVSFKPSDYGLSYSDFGNFGSGPGSYMDHSLSPGRHSFILYSYPVLDGDTIYIFLWGGKMVSRGDYYSKPNDLFHAKGVKVFKNSLTSGNSGTWVDTGWDGQVFELDGQVIIPLPSSYFVERGKMIFSSAMKFESWNAVRGFSEFNIDYADITKTSPPPATPQDTSWQSPILISGVFEVDLTSGILRKSGAISLADFSGSFFISGSANNSNWSAYQAPLTYTANPNSLTRFFKNSKGGWFAVQQPGIAKTAPNDTPLALMTRVGNFSTSTGVSTQLAEVLSYEGAGAASTPVNILSVDGWIGIFLLDHDPVSFKSRTVWTTGKGGAWIESWENAWGQIGLAMLPSGSGSPNGSIHFIPQIQASGEEIGQNSFYNHSSQTASKLYIFRNGGVVTFNYDLNF